MRRLTASKGTPIDALIWLRDLFSGQFRKKQYNGFKNHLKTRMIRTDRITTTDSRDRAGGTQHGR